MRLISFFCLLLHWAPVQAQDIEVESLLISGNSWDGSALPPYASGTPQITLQKIIIPPQTTLPWHSHPVVSAGVVLRGSLTVETRGGSRVTLNAGDAVVETVDTWHRGINEGPEPVEIIVFTAGLQDQPITVQEPQ